MTNDPPRARKVPQKLTKHGDVRVDDYYWLNNREDPEVMAYLKAENAYTEAMMSNVKSLKEDLYQEIIGRIKQEDQSVPFLFNDYYYQTCYHEGKEYPVYTRWRKAEKIERQIMLDVNVLAAPFAYYHVGGRSVSPDNALLAYGEDTVSRRIYTIRVKDLKRGITLEDKLENTTGYAVWANDNQTLFYTQKDEKLRAFKIFRHTLGRPQEEDVEIYHETDETFSCHIYKTKSQKYLVIGSYASLSNEYQILSADDPTGTFRLFAPREARHEHSIHHFHNKFYIRTNWEAENFRLMEAPESATSKEEWTQLIAHRQDVLLDDLEVFADFLVLSERFQGLTRLRVLSHRGSDHYVDFPEEAYTASTEINMQFDTEILRFTYTSLVTPPSTFAYNMRNKERKLLKQKEIVGDFVKEDYVSERHMVPARDGVQIPVSIVYRKSFRKNGKGPLLLYGYGSYGISIDPTFRSNRLSLLDRGFAFAIAHIRGGQEMGRRWYEDGKFLKKKNTFHDFIDCTKYLQKEKFSSPGMTFAMGGSAGGLLMGAVINEAADLYRGVVAAVPFVDVVTTMLDDSIPLTTGEYDEWGDPNDLNYYTYIKSYSPYDNIKSQDYPALLISTGIHDSQVQYWEPAKWVAKLRTHNTSKNPILLHCDMEAGHGGPSGRFKLHRETALYYAFLLHLVDH